VRFRVADDRGLFSAPVRHRSPRRLDSAERLDLRATRPDLDVRDSEWAIRVRESRERKGREARSGEEPEDFSDEDEDTDPPARKPMHRRGILRARPVHGAGAAIGGARSAFRAAAPAAAAAPPPPPPPRPSTWRAMAQLGRRLRADALAATRDVARELREALDASLEDECGSGDSADDGGGRPARGGPFFATARDCTDID